MKWQFNAPSSGIKQLYWRWKQGKVYSTPEDTKGWNVRHMLIRLIFRQYLNSICEEIKVYLSTRIRDRSVNTFLSDNQNYFPNDNISNWMRPVPIQSCQLIPSLQHRCLSLMRCHDRCHMWCISNKQETTMMLHIKKVNAFNLLIFLFI
jgi:hypothetical protein